ncbi:hypothetical protein BGZ60DRAFT_553738 [Tricladium varicosporioides]|nr:hypothetical protein BGZ60DRAFT_553738 [Hymenoscyphus varicosporioides]
MVDPLSLAGLTLAIFDELLKLADKTAEIVQDIRTFDEVSTELHDKILDEGNKTSILSLLLFENTVIYHGESLFEQFDEDVQVQIKLLLHQLKAILLEGFDLVYRRYGSLSSVEKLRKSTSRTALLSGPLSPKPCSPASLNSPLSTSLTNARKSSTSPLLLLRWTLRDKKRVETIVQNFRDMNIRIHDRVKLWCLASQLGVDLQHLKHLQSNKNSKALGFDIDATLKLTVWDVESLPSTLELDDVSWKEILPHVTKLNERFSTSEKSGKTLLLENFPYDIDTIFPTSDMIGPALEDYKIDSRARSRVDALAKLLHQPKELVFRIPRCIGWKYTKTQNSITFIFDAERRLECPPIDLLTLLSHNNIKPSLGDKFLLAHGLANCISQLHMVQWLHESFRSENVFFFPHQAQNTGKTSEVVNFSQPWVLGFEFSRPEDFFSAGPADFCAARDVYRHPERQGRPEARFNKLHDIYALGVVLLEIGLWEPALTLEKNKFGYTKNSKAIRDQLRKHAESRLASRVGEKYKQVVLRCLSSHFDVIDDTREDLKLQQAFRSNVVDVLEAAAKNV